MQLLTERVVGCVPDGKTIIMSTGGNSGTRAVIVSKEEWAHWVDVLEREVVPQEELQSLNFLQAA